MRTHTLKATLKAAARVACLLLFGTAAVHGQQQVNLTAAPTTLTLPDGSVVPMWGYGCGAVVSGSGATCAPANPLATGWSPVIITVHTGDTLQINLTNNLAFPSGGAPTALIPTSVVITGQLGAGLGSRASSDASPTHDNQGTTWPIANAGPVFTPPAQGPRVRSFSIEVPATAAGGTGTPATLTWTAMKAGTYLLESGTHPSIQVPMGLYGMVVVTDTTTTPSTGYPATGTAPAVTYTADARFIFGEIDPAQNAAVTTAVNTSGFSESATIGPYTGGSLGTINVTAPGAHYTSAPNVTFSSGNATAHAVVDLVTTSPTFGQVTEIDIDSAGTGYTVAPSLIISGGGGTGAAAIAALQLNANGIAHCSGGAAACYPPAVNYTPLYYLVNGVAFDKTNSTASLFPSSPATVTSGTVLVRLVNAGLRMHVPSIVGAQTGSAASGFSLIAEDGNALPGVPRVQSEVFMAAGKTYDVMINAPAIGSAALPVYDRELSLSGNAIARDSGMLAYLGVNGGSIAAGAGAGIGAAVARADAYNSLVQGQTLAVADPSKGLIANDTNVFGVTLLAAPGAGTVTLNRNGTFSYVPNSGTTTDSFTYCANGTVTGTTCSSGITATVTLGAAPVEAAGGIIMGNISYTAKTASHLTINTPGVLAVDSDGAGYPLTVDTTTVSAATGLNLKVDANGGFTATVASPGVYAFTYKAKNSQGTQSTSVATVTLTFPAGSGLTIAVKDPSGAAITDYRWVIEEDRTFYIDPANTTNRGGTTIVPTFGTNFHTSYMPLVAQGCTGDLSCESGQTVLDPTSGSHVAAVCDYGNGVCHADATELTKTDPKDVVLDSTKRYYISVLPGDAATPFNTGNDQGGHGMGGAPIAVGQLSATIVVQPTPFQTAKLSVFVFEDDFPLNGEHDAGGGIDILAPNEPGLGGFNITLFDDAGGTGDATGQMTYDMFNMPLANALAGTPDPATGNDACPISVSSRVGFDGTTSATGLTGTIVTCPKYESDGKTLSPLAGQVVVANMMPGRYGVVATPGADRIARGEEWLQTNTLDGQKAHDSFLRVGEPVYFQEYGPAGYHVTIGFANPAIINARLKGVCNGTDLNVSGANCTNSVTGTVTTERMSRTPDERLYSSGSNDSFAFTQCYVSIGDPDGEDFAFTKCDSSGKFKLSGLPDGVWRITVFDQWNDMLVDGLSTPVSLGGGATTSMGDIAMNQWQANIYTSTFFDLNKDGVRDNVNGTLEPGLSLVPTNIRFRDGSFSNFNNTDLSGNAGFNEVFPLFSWYVVEADTTRYKNTGTHVVYDAGGPADGSGYCSGSAPCGTSSIAANMANTFEQVPLPTSPVTLRVPGAVYCDNADCTGFSIATGPIAGGSSGPTTSTLSTGRIDPPWVLTEGWQGFSGQNSFLEFGKTPYAVGENGGIHGHVIYASTRPFDDPQLLLQTSWEPLVPGVTINLYQEGTAPDGSTSLRLFDTTTTSSWDDWAQGFRSDGVPNMNCPGQGRDTGTDADLFFFTLFNQPMWLDIYAHGGITGTTALPANSQFKCFDGMHNWNQLQPAPYDGMYQFPSVTSRDPISGKPTSTNCAACSTNPDSTDPYRSGTPMLPAGKYVVEVVVPPGYELVKEEDKNILIGDNYIAPVTQQFGGLGSIFILPDQAEIGSAYNPNNPQNPTNDLGAIPRHEGDTGSVESFWPCVGEARIVPDYISLFPQSGEVAPFAGATRRLCDRKEVTLEDQSSALAKFYVFTSTHVAAHFTGVITDDFTSEFDPFSPQYGEKFSPPNLPISIKDWTGTEVSRVYSDWWGTYNGLTYSTWEVNPPNPTGYAPQMMVTCMNDPGNGSTPDALFNPQYSQFCYEIPFMPGQTQYMDTPVVPTSAFAGAGYNNPDCAYPDATPAIGSVTSTDIAGPWVSAAGTGHTLTITALGNVDVPSNAYSGPSATTTPYNAKKVTRHYHFGSTTGTVALVGSDGVSHPLTNVSWGDTQIRGDVPSGLPTCAIQQPSQYLRTSSFGTELCGELVVTTSTGQKSIDTVTVTVGGQTPTLIARGASIQGAIDAAAPGDLIIVPAGVYNELILMWKPVRLQGVGAASSIINANTHPAGKLDPWRARVNCLFGLALNGQPTSSGSDVPNPGYNLDKTVGFERANAYDPSGAYSCPGSGWAYFNGGDNNPQVDRLPLEGIVGWDTTVNGNLAELLQEPSLMGAYEGAAITVLAKGVRFPSGVMVFGVGPDTAAGSNIAHESQMPLGTNLLTNGAADCADYPSNFLCAPSRIDGLGITDSSQGGGGIFVHAWGHQLEISNNRVYNNAGTMSGGINVGQGESPDALLTGNGGDPLAPLGGFDQQPWTCVQGAINPDGSQNANPPGFANNQQLPYCYNRNVNVHHNSITANSSIGDELFSASPAGAGGISFCTGADYYKFNYNWVCGNLSSGDGGGVAHMGFIYDGDIEHNTILFNQSTNPTIPTNGGGLIVMGAAPDGNPPGSAPGTECGSITDVDCQPGLSDGTGPGLVINANLIMGNAAESGSGGGLRLQSVNGTEIANFPATPNPSILSPRNYQGWNSVTVTNNIIANNVAGWDGAGVSLQDALSVQIVNNTIISNDSTASSGVLFNTLGAPDASAPTDGNQTTSSTHSAPQPAGLSSSRNSPALTASFPRLYLCPILTNSSCRNFSYPLLYSNVIWQNRSFDIGVGSLGAGSLNQQNVVALYNAFTNTAAVSQPQTDATASNGNGSIITGGTGACTAGASYWEVGVRGDHGPSDHSSGETLAMQYSVLSDSQDYSGNNLGANPTVAQQYCNGSRVPPELGSMGYQVPPGISDATVPNPIFNLSPAATVDEGNNWINISWGPLAEAHPLTGALLGNYSLANGSPAINYIPALSLPYLFVAANPIVQRDFFGNPRPSATGCGLLNAANCRIDVGAVEFQGTSTAVASVSPTVLNFGNVRTGLTATQNVTLSNTAGGSLTGITVTATAPFSRVGGTCGATLTVVQGSCTITVQFAPTAAGAITGTLTITGSKSIAGSPVSLNGTGVAAPTLASISPNTGSRGASVPVTLTGTNFASPATVNLPAGSGITVSNVVVQDSTHITATFAIGATAGLATRNVTVTTPGGTTTQTVGFTVTAAVPPTLTSLSPTSGLRGTAVTVALNGANFIANGLGVNVSGGGIAVSNVTLVSSTEVTATFTVSRTATATARNVTVTTSAGTTAVRTFTVVPPTLTSISPASATRSNSSTVSVNVTLSGSGLQGATGINVSGGGITVSKFTVVDDTKVTATFSISRTATRNARNVTVNTANNGTSTAVTFTVQ